MHRIDTSTAQVDKFGSGKNGFTGGNPQTGQLPTALDADYFDTLQEELAAVIESAGIILKKEENNQLLMAISTLTPGRLLGSGPKMVTASSTYNPTPGTKFAIVELVAASGGSGGVAATGSGTTVITSPSSQGTFAMFLYLNPVSQLITIGKGGAAGTSGGGTGGTGGNSSFGSLVMCPGGQGSYSATPSSGVIQPAPGASSAAPTINTGVSLISSIYGRAVQNAIQVSTGVATNFGASPQGPMWGSRAGASVDGVYRAVNSPAIAGNNGFDGACRIWEYA